jgi:hypothetical protein
MADKDKDATKDETAAERAKRGELTGFGQGERSAEHVATQKPAKDTDADKDESEG